MLISSYGGDTESEEEEEQTKAAEVSKENSEVYKSSIETVCCLHVE